MNTQINYYPSSALIQLGLRQELEAVFGNHIPEVVMVLEGSAMDLTIRDSIRASKRLVRPFAAQETAV